jgi:quercetin dioxygenase-like cupin family protein
MSGTNELGIDEGGNVPRQVRETRTIHPPVAASLYLSARGMDWQATEDAGFWIKPLYQNPEAGERTLLMKVDPGALAGRHAHDEFEQFYVLEGSLYDEERELRAGDYCCRAVGAPHIAGSRDGAIVLLVYTKALPISSER